MGTLIYLLIHLLIQLREYKCSHMEKELYPILFATVVGEGFGMGAMPIYLQLLPKADTSSLKNGSVCLSVFNNLTSQTRKL